jgi:hypothetical protein
MHERAVGEAMQARGGVDARDPQLAEIALSHPPITVGEFQPAQHGVFGELIDTPPCTPIAFSHLKHLFMAAVRRGTAGCPRHPFSFL